MFKHDNIIAMDCSIIYGEYMYIFMEYQDIDLKHYLCKLPDGETMPIELVKGFLLQMACGIDHIHTRNVIHRDIKPNNILINGSNIKV